MLTMVTTEEVEAFRFSGFDSTLSFRATSTDNEATFGLVGISNIPSLGEALRLGMNEMRRLCWKLVIRNIISVWFPSQPPPPRIQKASLGLDDKPSPNTSH
jgi:hypothetical protein